MTATATAVQTKQRPWWLMLIEGIAIFVIGAVLLWAPIKTKVNTYMFLVQLLGLYWVIRGIISSWRCSWIIRAGAGSSSWASSASSPAATS